MDADDTKCHPDAEEGSRPAKSEARMADAERTIHRFHRLHRSSPEAARLLENAGKCRPRRPKNRVRSGTQSVLQACRIVVFAKMLFRGAERRGISSVGGAELAQAYPRVEIPRCARNDSRSGILTFDICLLTFDLRPPRPRYVLCGLGDNEKGRVKDPPLVTRMVRS